MDLVPGVEALHRGLGRVLLAIGVFDGLHRGHVYLVERLVGEANRLGARPGVITFDAHPDAVLVGAAPPLLLDPDERMERLAAAGVEVAVVQHFDDAVRRTPFDTFVGTIAERIDLAGFVMTPDSAFGHQRRGTPEAVAALGERLGYEVIVAPALEVGGQAVSSSEIRRRIATGDLAGAAELIGRPYSIVGDIDLAGRFEVSVPLALPPPGSYKVRAVDGTLGGLLVPADGAPIVSGVPTGRQRLVFAPG
jgi:riboflavin kinase/FMN adenylyltransferase